MVARRRPVEENVLPWLQSSISYINSFLLLFWHDCIDFGMVLHLSLHLRNEVQFIHARSDLERNGSITFATYLLYVVTRLNQDEMRKATTYSANMSWNFHLLMHAPLYLRILFVGVVWFIAVFIWTWIHERVRRTPRSTPNTQHAIKPRTLLWGHN